MQKFFRYRANDVIFSAPCFKTYVVILRTSVFIRSDQDYSFLLIYWYHGLTLRLLMLGYSRARLWWYGWDNNGDAITLDRQKGYNLSFPDPTTGYYKAPHTPGTEKADFS